MRRLRIVSVVVVGVCWPWSRLPERWWRAAVPARRFALQLTPTAAPGTVVSGQLTVTTQTSAPPPRRGPARNVSTLAVLPYTYTVGPPAP